MASKVRIKQDLPYKSKQKSPETNWGVRITNEGKMNSWGPVAWIRWYIASIYIFVFVVYFHCFDAFKKREEADKKKKDI